MIDYLECLGPVAETDVAFIKEREVSYRGSWKKSGGRSAYFMAKRKMDRLTNLMQRPRDCISISDLDDAIDGLKDEADVTLAVAVVRDLRNAYTSEDVFAKIEDDASGDDGSVLAEIRDLRRYLLMIESEMVAQGIVEHPTKAMEILFEDLRAADEARNYPGVYQGDPRRLNLDDPPVPGTPADGGHHAYYDLRPDTEPSCYVRPPDREPYDGFPYTNTVTPPWSFVYVTNKEGTAPLGWYLVNRRHTDCSKLHLPRLGIELNEIEWRDLPPYYRALYTKQPEKGHVLPMEYREHWGKNR